MILSDGWAAEARDVAMGGGGGGDFAVKTCAADESKGSAVGVVGLVVEKADDQQGERNGVGPK